MPRPSRTALAATLLGLAASGCSKSGGQSDTTPPPPVPQYSVGGTLSGLASSASVTLQLNGGSGLTLVADGPFTFPTPLPDGSAFAVTVLAEPAGQQATVTGGTGVVSGGPVQTVSVACVDVYPVSGTVQGLTGAGLVLRLNGGSDLPVAADGPFAFPDPLPVGQPYLVTVATPPAGQVASVVHASGTVAPPGPSDVGVWCGTALFDVGGSVSGLTGGVLGLTLNGGDQTVAVGADGPFSFPTQLADGTPYSITVSDQPAGSFAQVFFGEGPVDAVDAADNTNAEVLVAPEQLGSDPAGIVLGLIDATPAMPAELDLATATPTPLLDDSLDLAAGLARAIAFDEAADRYWVADAASTELVEVDARGSVVQTVGATGRVFEGLGWAGADVLYGVAADGPDLRVFEVDRSDASTTDLGAIAVLGSPTALAVVKPSDHLFAATFDAAGPTVRLLELTATPAPVALVQAYTLDPAAGRVTGLAYDAKAGRLVATRADGSAEAYDSATGALLSATPGAFDGWPAVEGLAWEDPGSRLGALHSSAADGTALLAASAALDDVHAVRSLGRADFGGIAQNPFDLTVLLVRGTALYTMHRAVGDTRHVGELPGAFLSEARGLGAVPAASQYVAVGPSAGGEAVLTFALEPLSVVAASPLTGGVPGFAVGVAYAAPLATHYLALDGPGIDSLAALDVLTGAATAVGSTGTIVSSGDVVHDPAGAQLVATDVSTNDLFAVSPASGAASLIGSTILPLTALGFLD